MKKLAVISTVYFPWSHTDVIVSRWVESFPYDRELAGWQPQTEIASLFVAQFPERDVRDVKPDEWPKPPFMPTVDMARATSEKWGVPLYDSIEKALCLGGDSLAVDGVILIAEHGDYGFNEKLQKLYPRKEFFDEIARVFRKSGRSVPVFNDKHLSYNPDFAREMVATAREIGFPLMAGSSVPISGMETREGTFFEMPSNAVVDEAIALFFVGPETYGYHAIEMMQSFLEKRLGGERGVESLQVWEGPRVWEALESGVWPRELFDAALQMARHVEAGDIRENCERATYRRKAPRARTEFLVSPIAFRLRHRDGLFSTYIMLAGHIEDFVMALRINGETVPLRSIVGQNLDVLPLNFAFLNRKIQDFMLSGVPTMPLERTLFATQLVAIWMDVLWRQVEAGRELSCEIGYENL